MNRMEIMGFPHECTGQIAFPEGARMVRKEGSVTLLTYLRDNGLSDAW